MTLLEFRFLPTPIFHLHFIRSSPALLFDISSDPSRPEPETYGQHDLHNFKTGPNVEPCGTPMVLVASIVILASPIPFLIEHIFEMVSLQNRTEYRNRI